ncbi:DMT family transporter [Streptomyces sp. NPDC053755]|uniref:DMT family transporter n=1 Tax=Streptomyces sp. NPDC053755 TaxID=3155815 RepID=UPI0034354201
MTGLDGTVLAVLLSLVSAAGYALAAVAQARLAAASDGGGALRALLARGRWWWAVGLNAAGALAHVAALHYGPLTLVQPLGALTLVAALPLGARLARRRVTRAEWRGAFWTLAGLVGLVSVTGPAAPGEALSLREALIVSAATAGLIAVLASGRAGRVRRRYGAHGTGAGRARDMPAGRVRGLGHATASGMASGVASALTQTLTAALALELPGGSLPWWQTTLVALLISAFAVGGLLLSQTAYRGGLAAPLAVVNLSNPAAAAVIGVALLGETFRAGGWGWLVAATASLVAARGVVLLTTAGGAAGAAAAAQERVPAEGAWAPPTPKRIPADAARIAPTPKRVSPEAARTSPAPRRTPPDAAPSRTPAPAPAAPPPVFSRVLVTPAGLPPAEDEHPAPRPGPAGRGSAPASRPVPAADPAPAPAPLVG